MTGVVVFVVGYAVAVAFLAYLAHRLQVAEIAARNARMYEGRRAVEPVEDAEWSDLVTRLLEMS